MPSLWPWKRRWLEDAEVQFSLLLWTEVVDCVIKRQSKFGKSHVHR